MTLRARSRMIVDWATPRRRQLLAPLLRADELPGPGWQQIDEGVFRTGLAKSGQRSFRDDEWTRSLVCQVTPCASPTEARHAVRVTRGRSPRGATGRLSARLINLERIDGLEEQATHETDSEMPNGPMAMKLLVGSAGASVICIQVTSDERALPWEQVAALATKLARRART